MPQINKNQALMTPIQPEKDLADIASRLQQIFRQTRAFKKVHQLTNIDLTKQSSANLLDLYRKLRTVYGLSEAMQEAINKEKIRPQDALTPAELEFYKIIITAPLILNHASPAAPSIINSGTLYSLKESRRRKQNIIGHAGADYGGDDFVYFSYSLPKRIEVVQFLCNEDTFLFDFNNYQQDPAFLKGIWTSGHFYAFDHEQISKPRIFIGPTNTKTRLSIHYMTQFTPLVHYQREWIFQHATASYTYQESRAMTISAGAHIKPYHALKMIFLLRFMASDFRTLILENIKDEQLISDLFYSLFTPGTSELLVPALVNFSKSTPLPTLIRAKNIEGNQLYHDLKQYLLNGDDAALTDQLSLNPACKNWYYKHEGYTNLTLLNLAVLLKNKPIIRMLLIAGFDPEHEYINTRQNIMLSYAMRNSLQDAIEANDFELVQQLYEPESHLPLTQNIIFNCTVQEIHMYTAIAFHVTIEMLSYLLKFYRQNHSLDAMLLFAIEHNNSDALTLLLDAGANPNATNAPDMSDSDAHLKYLSTSHYTALTKAAHLGQVKNIEILLQAKYKTNVNEYVKKQGRYDRFGIGSNALLSAVHGFVKKGKERALGFRNNNELDARHLSSLPPYAQDMDYHTVIKLLLKAGAKADQETGNGISFRGFLAEYLHKNKEPQLKDIYDKLPKKTSKSSIYALKPSDSVIEYIHEAYALIIASDKNGIPHLLIAHNERQLNQCWAFAGGQANYMEDTNLRDTVVSLAAYQTGLDLTTIPSQKELVFQGNVQNYYELHTFKLSTPVEQLSYYTNTLECRKFERIVRASYPTNTLSDINFIPLDKISITPVLYKDALLPVCTYKNKVMPILSWLPITTLLMDKRYAKPSAERITQRLYFTGRKLFTEAIEKGQLDELKALLAVKIDHFENTWFKERCVAQALVAKQYPILIHLVASGYLLNEQYINTRIPHNYDKMHHTEDLLLHVYKTHIHLFTSYGFGSWATYAAERGHLKLIDMMDFSNHSRLYNAARSAIKHSQLEALKLLSTKVDPAARTQWFKKLVTSGMHLESDSKDFASAVSIAEYLFPYYEKQNNGFGYVSDLNSQFVQAVKTQQKFEIINRYLSLFQGLSSNNLLSAEDTYLYFIYRTIVHDAEKIEDAEFKKRSILIAEYFLNTLLICPMFKLIHAVEMKDHYEIDSLLKNNFENSLVRSALSRNSLDLHRTTDIDGYTCLSRQVQTGNLPLVRLLLEASRNNSLFNINTPDAQGQTLLMLAITKGHHTIAQLLIIHGAFVDEKILQLAPNILPALRSVRVVSSQETLVISSESPFEQDNQIKSGDCDYATQLSLAVQRSQPSLVTHYFKNNTCENMRAILQQKGPISFHLMLNAPRTGFAVSQEYLIQLKQRGVTIIITAIEFAKHEDINLKQQTLAYMKLADKIIFLDDEDKTQAINFATSRGSEITALTQASVIPVPPTVAPQNISTKKTASNIMCFGMLRRGKGFAHIIRLAELIKSSDEVLVNQKQIFIVGSVQYHQTRRNNKDYDPTLYSLLKAMYPEHADRFYNKTPEELVHIYTEFKDIPSVLPIKLYLNVEEQDLPALFEQCEYSFYPAYRGATLRNSSISTSLAFTNIIYSHMDTITPQILGKQGLYHEAMVLFDDDNYHTYAAKVLEDISLREKDKKELGYSWNYDYVDLNTRTRIMINALLTNELSLESVAMKHLDVYCGTAVVNTNSNTRNVHSFFNTPTNVEDTTKDVNQTEITKKT